MPGIEALLAESARRNLAKLRIPDTYLGFLHWMGVTPTPYQRVFCQIAYDGAQPEELDVEDRRIAGELFAAVGRFDDRHRHAIFPLAGGRAGKTYIFGGLRLVWGAYTRDLSSLAPGQRAVALCVGPKDVHRQEIINYQLGAIRSRPELKATIISPRYLREDDRPESFAIKRPDGHIVSFEGGTANRGGYGGRGRSLTDCLLDEMAFFQDANHVVNDREIFKAASPRVLPGGQIIGQTTAWAKAGYHWERWCENFGHPVTGIAARATTEQLRPSAADMVARERAVDPDNARREFDAEPVGEAPQQFFSQALIDDCLDLELRLPRSPSSPDDAHPEERCAGIDIGLTSNSSALAIGHRAYSQVMLADLREWRPQNGVSLRPSEVTREAAAVCEEHGVTMVMGDGHYRESVREALPASISFVDAPMTPSEAFVRARRMMRDGLVRLPDPKHLPEPQASLVRRLLKQLLDVRGAPRAGGGMTITMPVWADGSHCDMAQALIDMVHSFGDIEKEAPPREGSQEWEEQERAKRRQALVARARR